MSKGIITACPCCRSRIQVDTATGIAETLRVDLTFDTIIYLVCQKDGVPPTRVAEKCRKREIVYARQKIYWLGSMYTQLTYKQMAGKLGGQDHTTVIHAMRSLNDLMDTEPAVRKHVEALMQTLDKMKELEAAAN